MVDKENKRTSNLNPFKEDHTKSLTLTAINYWACQVTGCAESYRIRVKILTCNLKPLETLVRRHLCGNA